MPRFITTAAILGLTTAFAQPVLADDHADMDMLCADFLVLSEADRGSTFDALAEAGREGAREEARGDDTEKEGVEEWDVDVVMTECEANPDKKVSDVMMHPTDG